MTGGAARGGGAEVRDCGTVQSHGAAISSKWPVGVGRKGGTGARPGGLVLNEAGPVPKKPARAPLGAG